MRQVYTMGGMSSVVPSYLGSMDDEHWWVFISSAMALAKDRQAAVEIAESLGWFRVWWWEDSAYPGVFSPDELYLEKAANADVLVLLVREKITPNTKREYDISVQSQRYQMVFFRQVSKREASAEEFKASLEATGSSTYWVYRNQSELKTCLGRGLRQTFVRLARKGLQSAIGTRSGYSV